MTTLFPANSANENLESASILLKRRLSLLSGNDGIFPHCHSSENERWRSYRGQGCCRS